MEGLTDRGCCDFNNQINLFDILSKHSIFMWYRSFKASGTCGPGGQYVNNSGCTKLYGVFWCSLGRTK